MRPFSLVWSDEWFGLIKTVMHLGRPFFPFFKFDQGERLRSGEREEGESRRSVTDSVLLFRNFKFASKYSTSRF